jgi:murein DD-endopeptidase MepM/ murein hydrolase activator NlpD
MSRVRRRFLGAFMAGYALGLASMVVMLWIGGMLHPASVSAHLPIDAARLRSSPYDTSLTPDEEQLVLRGLALPIAGLKLQDLQDSFNDTRGGTRRHEATDILASRGSPVMAVDDGTIRKLFTSRQGGLTVYQFDREESYCYYYAHLDHYAAGLEEGMPVRREQVIGYVGTTGNANTPHLHLAVFKLSPEKRWWEGKPINPYPALMDALKTPPSKP